jgi:hypothetical protein
MLFYFVGGERREEAGEGERERGAPFLWLSPVFHFFGVECKSRNHAC